MNYDDMSDYQVNKNLALLVGMKVQDVDDESSVGMTTKYHERYPNTIWAAKTRDGIQVEPWEQICFTGEWEHIGALIEEYELQLDPRRLSKKLGWMASFSDKIYAVDHNAKRAAAICIIQLLESK